MQLLHGWPTSLRQSSTLSGRKPKQNNIFKQFTHNSNNFSRLRKFEVYSLHMLLQPFLFCKLDFETSRHFLVTEDQNPFSLNLKSLVTVTASFGMLGDYFFLPIRNSTGHILKSVSAALFNASAISSKH